MSKFLRREVYAVIMSNQIETAITVQLENRDRNSVALRIFLVVPMAIFISAFTAWSGSTETSTFLSGLLFLPVLLALIFRGKYPSYILDFNYSGNFPCAYTDFATCPVSPVENKLPIAIEAGEKKPLYRNTVEGIMSQVAK